MFCTKCGRREADGTEYCGSCGSPLVRPAERETAAAPARAQDATDPATIWTARWSGLAAGSVALGLLGIPTVGASSVLGLVLGSIGLVEVRRSGGALRGQGWAIAGIALSALTLWIMLPVRIQMHEQAKERECLSNLKQLSTALFMYMQDSDGVLPVADRWCDRLSPYLKSDAVFRCPSLGDQRSGFAFNRILDSTPQSTLRAPGNTAALFDATGGWNVAGGAELADRRHIGGLNVGFADGHFRFLVTLDSVRWKPR